MGARIIRIGELVEDDAAPLVAQLLRHIARQFHAARLAGQHQFRAICRHALATLDALIFRHHQNHPVAAHGGHHRQRNAGVSAGRLDQRVTGLDVTALFGATDHRQRWTVLDRTGRIIAFQLRQDDVAAPRVVVARNALQSHQRCVADEVFECLVFHDDPDVLSGSSARTGWFRWSAGRFRR
jgi:hypothetical protein